MDDKIRRKVLRKHTKGPLGALKDTAKNAIKPDIKLPEIKKPNVKIPQVKELLSKRVSDEPVPEEISLKIVSISTRNALKIIYYLMTADGQLLPTELEQFDLLGQELSPDYSSLKESIVKECQAQMDKVIDAEDYYDVVQEGVEDALLSSVQTEDSFITPKLLIWDLLTIAYSDDSYDETERKLIKFIVRKCDVDRAIFLEMESAIQTTLELEKEQQWLKNTDRPYGVIEAMVNEIEDRKHVIFESIKDLISL